MTKGMRYFVAILCLLSLAFTGPVSAACAADLGDCADVAMASPSGSEAAADCDMGQASDMGHKLHKCSHDACCGYQLAAMADAKDVPPPAPLRVAALAAPTMHLTGFGWETLLDPPRA